MARAPADNNAEARHTPVLLPEVLENLAVEPGRRYIDGTFGAGGYSRAILERGGEVLAIDRDRTAVEAGQALVQEFQGRLRLVEGRFSDLQAHAEAAGFEPDGIVLDVGVSSMQLDDAERGFSFRFDGPLDMRMGASGPDAAAVVNRASVKELATIIGGLGEEKKAGRIARAIEAARREAPIERTAQLAEIVARAAGPAAAAMRIHPATRTFQALRIYINRELEELAEALAAAEAVLKSGGRLVVVAFHSLEDRIVKRFLQERSRQALGSRHAPLVQAEEPTFQLLTRKAVEPTEAEIAANPRARSSRLRAGMRTSAPPRAVDFRALGVPGLGDLPGPEAFA